MTRFACRGSQGKNPSIGPQEISPLEASSNGPKNKTLVFSGERVGGTNPTGPSQAEAVDQRCSAMVAPSRAGSAMRHTAAGWGDPVDVLEEGLRGQGVVWAQPQEEVRAAEAALVPHVEPRKPRGSGQAAVWSPLSTWQEPASPATTSRRLPTTSSQQQQQQPAAAGGQPCTVTQKIPVPCGGGENHPFAQKKIGPKTTDARIGERVPKRRPGPGLGCLGPLL